MTAHKKPTRMVTPGEGFQESQPIFSKNEFDKAIESKGYDVFIEKALKCPCSGKSVNVPNPMCRNCGGTGWFFVEKRKTVAVVQSMNRRTKFLNWSESDRGTISITLKGEDRVAFMDKVKVMEVESVFSQNVVVRKNSINEILAVLFYEPIEVELCYVYKDLDNKHVPLKSGIDFIIEEDRLIFTGDFAIHLDEENEATVSVRYKYNPTYHILDINREIVKTFSTDERFDEDKEIPVQDHNSDTKQVLPVNSIARKAHFVYESPNLLGDSLHDNTVYES